MAVLLLLLSQSAQSNPVKWTFLGHTFTGGGTATGSFIYDADTNTYSSINIVTSAAASPLGATYVAHNNAFGFPSTASLVMVLSGLPVVLNDPILWMGFASPLTNAGGVVGFNFTQETGCSLINGGLCQGTGGTNPSRNVATGQLTTTPTVTPSAGPNGTINPSTPQTINHGSTTQFTVTPDTGYSAAVAGSCGGSLVGMTYTTSAITADCTVVASFTLIPVPTSVPVFGLPILIILILLVPGVVRYARH